MTSKQHGKMILVIQTEQMRALAREIETDRHRERERESHSRRLVTKEDNELNSTNQTKIDLGTFDDV